MSGSGEVRLGEGQVEALLARLEAVSEAAEVFGSAVSGIDVRLSWTVGRPRPVEWRLPAEGQASVSVELAVRDLASGRAAAEAFRAAFLHELGHLLHTPPLTAEAVRRDALARAVRRAGSTGGAAAADRAGDGAVARGAGAQAVEAGTAAREGADRPPALEGLEPLFDALVAVLEDARVDGLLQRGFRGAGRYLGGREADLLGAIQEASVRPASGAAEAEALVALFCLALLGSEEVPGRLNAPGPAGGPGATVDLRSAPASSWIGETFSRLRPRLPSEPTFTELVDFVLWDLVPELSGRLEFFGQVSEAGAGQDARAGRRAPGAARESSSGGGARRGRGGTPADATSATPPATGPAGDDAGEEDSVGEALEGLEALAAPGLGLTARPPVFADPGSRVRPDTTLIFYPHVGGGLVVDDLRVAEAALVPPSEDVEAVLEDLHDHFGPAAEEAFAPWSAALRGAFQVNFERRHAGRYRSGRRIGTTNLRRYVTSRDLRLFQRLEVPERLSYYLHLLIDVSPSMFPPRNAQMALAVGWALTDLLEQLRVPVDVTLYSSGVTVLHRAGRPAPDRFFGRFGFDAAGTYEIEALAFARLRAARVPQKRKIFVVVTDGRPTGTGLHKAGARDLGRYYRDHLLPWLRRDGVDVLCIGVGTYPDYHEQPVCLTTSWEAIGVFVGLLEEIIAEGDRRHHALWA